MEIKYDLCVEGSYFISEYLWVGTAAAVYVDDSFDEVRMSTTDCSELGFFGALDAFEHSGFIGSWLVRSQILVCSDDSSFEPEEGIMEELQFNWLGILQYIHIKNGTPHYFRAPRVILISRLFVLATAKDAAQVPEDYALGNVIFGDYERDELECGLTSKDFNSGTTCEPAIVIVPLVDVLVHPEYKHYGAENSVALLKMIMPIKSAYMIPVCLPFRDYLSDRTYSTNYTLWHVDFASSVPRNFFDEEKEVTQLHLLPQALCFLYDESENITTEVAKRRVMCTTNCDFHSGAPTVLHEHTGHWTAVSISEGSAPCPDPLRSKRPPPPPRHIKLHPYVPWITAALTGKNVQDITSTDPFGYTLPRQAIENNNWSSWVGHWWLAGMPCYDRGYAARKYFRFYHELFSMKPRGETSFTYFVHINGAVGTKIICVKVKATSKTTNPRVWALETSEVMLRIVTGKSPGAYKFEVEAWATKDETRSKLMKTNLLKMDDD